MARICCQPQLHPIIHWKSRMIPFSPCLTAAPVFMVTLFKYGHCKSTPHICWSLIPTTPDWGFSSPAFIVITPLLGQHLFQVFHDPGPWFLTHPCSVRASGSRKVSVMASYSPGTNLPPVTTWSQPPPQPSFSPSAVSLPTAHPQGIPRDLW